MARTPSAPYSAAPWSAFAATQGELAELICGADARWADPAWRQALERWRHRASRALLAALQGPKSTDHLAIAEAALSDLAHCGGADFPSSAETAAEAAALAAQGWTGLAAATLLVPSWQATFLPPLKDAPLWLLPHLGTYCFAAPRILMTAGQAEAYARVHLAALDSLVGLAEANRGSVVIRALADRYRAAETCPVLNAAPALQREIRTRRGRLLAALERAPAETEPFFSERNNRPLRVGVVAISIPQTPAALSLVRLLERLPPTRFSTTLLVQRATQSEAQRQLQNQGAALTILPGDTAQQMAQALREASLDVAVFLIEGSWFGNPVAELCLRRSVAVQIVHDGTGLPSGLSQADLYVASPPVGPSAGERALLLGPAGFTGTGGLPAAQTPEIWTRTTIGMEDAAVVFGVLVDLRSVTPEFETALASILAATPGSRLVVVAPPVPGYRVDRFCAAFLQILAARGIQPERVGVFADVALGSHDERKACFGAIDVLLDPTVDPTADMACAAIAAGRPVVAWPRAAHPVAALLRQCGMEELVATEVDGFVQTAARLGRDTAARQNVISRLVSVAPRQLLRYDSIAGSEAFAEMLESAYDRVVTSRRTFRQDAAALEPTRPESAVAAMEEAELFLEVGALHDAEIRLRRLLFAGDHPLQIRRRLADVLLRAGRPAEAVDLLLSIAHLVADDASALFEIGLAARQADRAQLALEAMQAGVRLDPRRVESWHILAELARENRNSDLLEQINMVLRELGETVAEPALAADR